MNSVEWGLAMCGIDWAALGTWAAVVVALFLPVFERRKKRISERELARLILPSILLELKWVLELAGDVLSSYDGPTSTLPGGISYVDDKKHRSLILLAGIEFPVFQNNHAVLMGADDFIVRALHVGYSGLYRGQISLQHMRDRLVNFKSPDQDGLERIIRVASEMKEYALIARNAVTKFMGIKEPVKE